MRKIGVLGGTFDPIHNAHLMIAEHAYSEMSLDTVWFMPTGKSPHKEENMLTDISQRLKMVQVAIQGNPHFSLSTFEIDVPETSYTYRTAQRLKEAFPEDRFYFICGADSLRNFRIWRNPEVIAEVFTLVVAVRDEAGREELSVLADEYEKLFGAKVFLLSVPNFSISSTNIRERIREGRSVRYLLPDTVLSFIEEKGLYR